jgi:hypothetical protein
MSIVLRIVAMVAGSAVVAVTFLSAVRAFVVPRASPVAITRVVFVSLRWVFWQLTRRQDSYADKDETMALFAPMALLLLPGAWLGLILTGYSFLFWGLEHHGARDAFALSSSSLVTLGFTHPRSIASTAVAVSEAMLGIGLLALLITYLPAIYSAFSRREAAVTALEIRAGSPPSAVEMIWRYWVLRRIEVLHEVWDEWEDWFVDVEETHTSFGALAFFRSPQPDHSWVTAAGAVLDGAALAQSCFPQRSPTAQLCLRAGYVALRRVADFFAIPYDADPAPDDPITIGREEFDAAFDRLAREGVPLVSDRDQAWRDFAGWRVNYDAVLVTLAQLVMAPYAPWSSDRSATFFRVRVLRRVAGASRASPSDRRRGNLGP